MSQHVAPMACKPWTLNGLSDELIVSHYENNYGGAVKRLNAIAEQLGSLDFATAPVFCAIDFQKSGFASSDFMSLPGRRTCGASTRCSFVVFVNCFLR